jgi:hypothetical protein
MYKNEEYVLAIMSAAGTSPQQIIDICNHQHLEEDERVRELSAISGLDTKKIKEALKSLALIFTNILNTFKEAIEPLWGGLNAIVEHVNFKEFFNENKHKRELYKRDFTKLKVQHQVLNRKPRYLVKKVIR